MSCVFRGSFVSSLFWLFIKLFFIDQKKKNVLVVSSGSINKSFNIYLISLKLLTYAKFMSLCLSKV